MFTELKTKIQRLVVLADFHWGCGSTHVEGVKAAIKRAIKYPWIMLGDTVEGIAPGDKRFEIDQHKDSLLTSMSEITKIMYPARKTCIGLIEGNHERAIGKTVGNITDMIAQGLGVPALTDSCFVRFGDTLGFFCHKANVSRSRVGNSIRIKAAKEVSLFEAFRKINADFCGMGHVHQSIVKPPVFVNMLTEHDMGTKMTMVAEDPKWCFSTPAMYMTYGDKANYGSSSLMAPTQLGWTELVFNQGKPGLEAIEVFNEKGQMIQRTGPMMLLS